MPTRRRHEKGYEGSDIMGPGIKTIMFPWHVDDVEASLQRLLDAGARTQQPVKDLGGGRLSAIARDPSGNVIGLIKAH